jgi:hypothetical protein
VKSVAPYPKPDASPLSILPLGTVLRSFFVTTISSYPLLLGASLSALSFLANSKSALLDPDRNICLKYALGKTMYAQFCAGETPAEVKHCVRELKGLGYSGVILAYAKEAVMDEDEARAVGPCAETGTEDARRITAEISAWRDGTLKTVELAGDGDFVAVKFTGAGKQALLHLAQGLSPSPTMEQAITDICEMAKSRNVRLLVDAEQQAVQPTIDEWTLDFQRKYNNGENRRALIYATYQAYLRSTPTTLSRHLAVAEAEGFVLGVKLVRGAYLGTEPRHLIWQEKEETDRTYDCLAERLIRRQYQGVLKLHNPSPPIECPFPEVDLLLASHNRASVERAQEIRNEQSLAGEKQIEMAYGQLLGMADDISCELVQKGKNARELSREGIFTDAPKAYKALVWGTVGECTNYLLRRGQENRDAASRTENTRRAMAQELRRRLSGR